ncbi:MAG: hypothetical protein F6K00_27230 [Leptolyngbya sp. SIOISBB]|nr:hypothetical protein [Leptolyngbya sp. SIOISBB]
MQQIKRQWGWIVVSVLVWGGIAGLACSATVPGSPDSEAKAEEPVGGADDEESLAKPDAEKDPLTQAFEAAMTAAQLAQSATTANEWSAVATAWSEAIQALQAVPTDSPEWLFAQRKTREYLNNQEIALQRVEASARLAIFPPLGNDILDEQLALYLSYVATFDTPDIMIIGSSRALQGMNPQILQQRLAQQGYTDLRVYNFAVNGATAQVVSFILRQLLTPEQMPKMIIWAGGSRSFNSGRFDRTFAKILESPGYAAVQAGDRPTFESLTPLAATLETTDAVSATGRDKARVLPVSSINGYGFLAVNDVFEPNNYYRSFPRVAGAYDDAYQNFNLEGVQAVSTRAIAAFTRTNNIPLVFVNLPLSEDYLDETRLFYEQQFQQFLAQEAQAGGFILVDLLRAWPGQNNLFADPSHLNRVGAAQVAIRVSEDDAIPWTVLVDEATLTGDESSVTAEDSE